MQLMECARERAWFRAGSSMPARIAMMAMTTRSSISVKFLIFLCMVNTFLSLVKVACPTVFSNLRFKKSDLLFLEFPAGGGAFVCRV